MLDVLRLSLSSRAFLFAAILVGSSAFGLHWYADSTGKRFRKAAAPIRKPLKYFDRDILGPYKFYQSFVLQSEEEEALGTREYLNWVLEDTSITNANDPLRWVRLFVTYYTDSPDQVPHVPDVCYLGSGFTAAGGGTRSFALAELGRLGYDTDVPYRALTFVKPSDVGQTRETVVYTFGVNNVIRADRRSVRNAMSNLTDKYAYFSKVEIAFGLGRNVSGLMLEKVEPQAEKLLALVLPELIREHWPDLKELELSASGTETAASGSPVGGTPGPAFR